MPPCSESVKFTKHENFDPVGPVASSRPMIQATADVASKGVRHRPGAGDPGCRGFLRFGIDLRVRDGVAPGGEVSTGEDGMGSEGVILQNVPRFSEPAQTRTDGEKRVSSPSEKRSFHWRSIGCGRTVLFTPKMSAVRARHDPPSIPDFALFCEMFPGSMNGQNGFRWAIRPFNMTESQFPPARSCPTVRRSWRRPPACSEIA